MTAAVLLGGWALAALLAFLDGTRRWPGRIAIAGFALLLAGAAALLAQVVAHGPQEMVAGGWPPELGIRLRADALGLLFAVLTTGVLLAAVTHEVTGTMRTRSFPALVAFMAVGLNGAFLTGDVFNFYVFFELSMIAGVALVAYGGEAPRMRAAYTFAVVNLLGSVFFLGGTAALYHVTGTLEMAVMPARVAELPPGAVLAIGAVFFVAFGVKLGLFPFHFWVPPVYRDAHPAVGAILSGALANVGIYGLLRFGGDVLAGTLPASAAVLAPLAAASLVYGSVLAIGRRAVGEVLAYSSIGQAGYVLLVLTLATPAAFAAAIVYAVVNSLNKTLLFLSLPLRGATAAILFGIGAASVAGLPPAAGFFGKVSLFGASAAGGHVWMVAAIAAGSMLSIAYMAGAYAVVLRGQGPRRTPLPAQAASAALAGLVLFLGLWPEPLLSLAGDAGRILGGAP